MSDKKRKIEIEIIQDEAISQLHSLTRDAFSYSCSKESREKTIDTIKDIKYLSECILDYEEEYKSIKLDSFFKRLLKLK